MTEVFVCPSCGGPLIATPGTLRCASCDRTFAVRDGIPRFVESRLHASFALQWNRFWDVQLDSRNGTTLSRARLLDQSRMRPEEFAGKRVLEVGCGAGRFTEVLLSFGANVVAVDYSAAVDACASSNQAAIADGRLTVAQADVFALPVRPGSFDIVVGYGMLQHTGDPTGALRSLWDRVAPGGSLLVDRYQFSLRQALPFKYALRPLLSRLPPEVLLRWTERVCMLLVPFERVVLRHAQGNGPLRFARYILGRFPNSTFPLNLEAQGVIGSDLAFRWSVLDTFDQYASRYDLPCTAARWRAELAALASGRVTYVASAGQGNVGVVVRL
jgi:2-polyprenyl-3-methyl-5-hydroxy-6-metoxy-1,4-benzoquinol methylase